MIHEGVASIGYENTVQLFLTGGAKRKRRTSSPPTEAEVIAVFQALINTQEDMINIESITLKAGVWVVTLSLGVLSGSGYYLDNQGQVHTAR